MKTTIQEMHTCLDVLETVSDEILQVLLAKFSNTKPTYMLKSKLGDLIDDPKTLVSALDHIRKYFELNYTDLDAQTPLHTLAWEIICNRVDNDSLGINKEKS